MSRARLRAWAGSRAIEAARAGATLVPSALQRRLSFPARPTKPLRPPYPTRYDARPDRPIGTQRLIIGVQAVRRPNTRLRFRREQVPFTQAELAERSEEHTSELQS